jgi:membrane-anchored protein YejM (alkaline phosphatase superfamily)
MLVPEVSVQPSGRASVWFSARIDAYIRVMTALCLGVPLLFLLLVRFVPGFHFASLAGVYITLVLLGYYVLVLLFVTTCVFVVLSLSRRLATAACASLLVLALFYLIVDGTVYRLYRFHADAFSLSYVVDTFTGIGIAPGTVAIAAGLLAATAVVVWFLFRLAARVRLRRRLVLVVASSALVAFLASQALSIVAYEKNDSRITNVTLELPFYYPIRAEDAAVKYGHLLPMVAETAHASGSESLAFAYPRDLPPAACVAKRRPNVLLLLLESWRFDTMDATVSPHMYAFSQRSSVFRDHFSSGNATPTGVFGLFYGIHPTYWSAVKANSAAIDNPVLIDVLKANAYSFGIFADSHFASEKIKDTVFRDIDVHEDFKGKTVDEKDRDMNDRLLDFARHEHAAKRPFFAFAFYKSTHARYSYPKEATRFTPTHKLNVAFVGKAQDRTLYMNEYKNAVSYVDDLVGDVLSGLETSGMLDSTIVIITSDHGEEFDDNKADYWGHASNFTGFQTRVPMIIYVPWEKPRQVDALTMHIDIPPTILEEGLGCASNEAAYTNGHDLFGPLTPERPVVIGSYVNYAVVIGDDVSSVFPMYVQKYKLWDINAKAGTPSAGLVRKAMEEMDHFYRGGNVTG